MLMKTADQTLTEQLASHFAERIRSRLLAAGARLPWWRPARTVGFMCEK